MKPIRRLRRARGQSLLLFALSLLLLTLMVVMTLGLGMRVRENHEAQTMADAAAYSNAVATARTFNNISLLNRLQISHYVAMAADESLISWTSLARGYVDRAIEQAESMCVANGCNDACLARDFLTVQREQVLLKGEAWDDADAEAGREVLATHGVILGLINETQGAAGIMQRLVNTAYPPAAAPGAAAGAVGAGTLGARIIGLGGAGAGELSFVPNGIGVREIDCGTGFLYEKGAAPSRRGSCIFLGWAQNMTQAVGASRRNAFVVGRAAQMAPLVTQIFAGVPGIANGVTVVPTPPVGSGSFGPSENNFDFITSERLYASDTGTVVVTAPNCGNLVGPAASQTVTTQLRSDATNEFTDLHAINGAQIPEVGPAVQERHSTFLCIICSATWVPTFGFFPGPGEAAAQPGLQNDANGQPKNYAVLMRDYSKRAVQDPWTVPLFRFDFDRDGQTTEFSNKGDFIESGGAGRMNISQQAMMATGMAYYHRRNANPDLRWREFPNFLNPYWRATLVAADVDETAVFPNGRDISDTLNTIPGANGFHRDAYEKLIQQGYKGIH